MRYLAIALILVSAPAWAGPLAVFTPQCDSFNVKETDIKAVYNACTAKGGAPTIVRKPSPTNPALECPVAVTCSK